MARTPKLPRMLDATQWIRREPRDDEQEARRGLQAPVHIESFKVSHSSNAQLIINMIVLLSGEVLLSFEFPSPGKSTRSTEHSGPLTPGRGFDMNRRLQLRASWRWAVDKLVSIRICGAKKCEDGHTKSSERWSSGISVNFSP